MVNIKRKNVMMVGTIAIFVSLISLGGLLIIPAETKKSGGKSLIQIASLPTDFPNNDPHALQFHVTKATKNILGYEIDGEVVNVSNKTFFTRPIVVRMFDKDNGPVGSPTGNIGTTQLAPNHSGTFKILINPDDLLGKATSYRLTFTGTFQ